MQCGAAGQPAHGVAHITAGRAEHGGRAEGTKARAAEACRACESVRRGAQRAQPASGSSGARTLSAAEEARALWVRTAFQKRDAGGMLVRTCTRGSSFVMNCDYFPFRLPLRYRVALGLPWVALGGLGWAWVALGCLGLPWVGMGGAWVALGCLGLPWVGLGCLGLPWVCLGLPWAGPWVGLGCLGYAGG